MRTRAILAGIAVVIATSATPALAQRFPFDRSFDVTGPSTLDVSTIRGKIDVVAGKPGRISVTGVVTVRVAWDVPASALELAQQVAAATSPQIVQVPNAISDHGPQYMDTAGAVPTRDALPK